NLQFLCDINFRRFITEKSNMSTIHRDMSLAGQPPTTLSTTQKVAMAFGWIGLFIFFLSLLNLKLHDSFLFISLGLISVGVVLFAMEQYRGRPEGIKNDGVWFRSISSRGSLAWGLGILLTLVYVVLYWFPELLGY